MKADRDYPEPGGRSRRLKEVKVLPNRRAFIALVFVLAACGGGPLAAGDAEVARGSAPFEPSATATDITALVAADTAFSLDLISRAAHHVR